MELEADLADELLTMIEVLFHDLVTLKTDNDMRVKARDQCRVIRVRSEIVILQLLLVL